MCWFKRECRPVFQKQIRDNQQLTITHPDIMRFFMTTREAVSLVLQGFAIGNHGDTLLLDMGEPVRILDLAKTLIRLSGKSEHEVGIRFTGCATAKSFSKNFLTRPKKFIRHRSLRSADFVAHRIAETIWRRNWFSSNRHVRRWRCAIRTKMKEIVPEYYKWPRRSA